MAAELLVIFFIREREKLYRLLCVFILFVVLFFVCFFFDLDIVPCRKYRSFSLVYFPSDGLAFSMAIVVVGTTIEAKIIPTSAISASSLMVEYLTFLGNGLHSIHYIYI